MKIKSRPLCILLVLLPIIAVAGAVIINELYRTGKGYITVWGGAEVLAFFGSVLSALGSATIGVVAWNQNKRILKVQEESFLVQNFATVVVDSIRIGGFEQTACNYELYDNPIVATNESHIKANSVSIVVKMLSIENIPALIKIKRVFLYVYNQETPRENAIVDAKGIDSEYSRVAISKDKNAFVNILLLLSDTEKQELKGFIENNEPNNKLEIDIDMEIVSPKYVSSQIKCRAFLKNGESISFYEQGSNTTPPVLFMYGKEIIDPTCLGIKNESHYETNNEECLKRNF